MFCALTDAITALPRPVIAHAAVLRCLAAVSWTRRVAMVADVFASVSNVFAPITHIFYSVLQAAVVPLVIHILSAIFDIFTSVAEVFSVLQTG
mgnify:CR=1 FL=1